MAGTGVICFLGRNKEAGGNWEYKQWHEESLHRQVLDQDPVWERKEEHAGWDSPREAIEEVETRRLLGSALGIGGRGQAQESVVGWA